MSYMVEFIRYVLSVMFQQIDWSGFQLKSFFSLALTIHYQSQCIPTTLAWYFHHLPTWFHKLSVVATYFIEILLPFLFYAPIRKLRLFACYGQVEFTFFPT